MSKKGVIADQFYAERLYTRNSITDLLTLAGLSKIQLHSEVKTESKRNQDLGMMEKRILVSAIAQKDWTPANNPGKNCKTVAVLMGDPNLYDAIKPEGNFDQDDFFTIDKLKQALAELPGYNFVYLNQHSKLIHDLQKLGDKLDFVFNLCDEGFNNQATKELHIPSLLEILDLSYTGGTPQCLVYCYDKSLTRGIAQTMDIPVPKAFMVKPEDISFIDLPLDFPVIVKPNFGDSSFGITQDSVCHNVKMLEVNPNPGWCWDGHLAKMAKLAGISYLQMLGKILQAGEARIMATTSSLNSDKLQVNCIL